MPLPNLLLPDDLSKKDFAESNYEEVINKLDRKEIREYSSIFWSEAQKAKESEDFKKYTVFTLISVIAFPTLKRDQEPFKFDFYAVVDLYKKIEGESEAIKLIISYLNILEDWVRDITDTELRARVTDFIWLENHDRIMAKLAVNSYLKSAKNLEDPVHWNLCFTRIKRAIGLAQEINYHFNDVVAYIEEILDKYAGKVPSLLSAKLMKLLQDYQKGNPFKYADLAEEAAIRADDQPQADEYRQIKDKWHDIHQDNSIS
jgi:rubrerythrin